jgi:diguanylate cyclase (GGDEF)-like protein/PAS domain S-box-containing protein
VKGDSYMIEKFNLEILNRIDLFFQLFNNMTDLVFLTKVENGTYSYVLANKPAMALVGISDEAFGKPINEVLPKKAYQLIESKYKEAMEKKKPIKYEDKITVPPALTNGKNYKYSPNQLIYWESTITPVFNQNGDCTHMLAIVRDITDQRQKENEIKRIKDRLELVWNSVADAMYTFDKNENFVSVNKSFENLLGRTEEEIVNKRSISIIPEDSKEDLREIINRVKSGETVPTHEVKRKTKAGEMIDFLASYSPIYDNNGDWDGGVAVYKDITERKRYEDKLKQLALHDPLTGLPNRNYYSQCLRIELDKAKQTKSDLAVLLLDIDHFKDINDTFGHDIGDEVLIEFASRVKNALRKDDIMARIGGDEFIIVLPDLTDSSNATEICERIQQSLLGEWQVKAANLKITSSMGIAFYNECDLAEKTLYKHADLALYEAKNKGRNNYQIYKNNETG